MPPFQCPDLLSPSSHRAQQSAKTTYSASRPLWNPFSVRHSFLSFLFVAFPSGASILHSEFKGLPQAQRRPMNSQSARHAFSVGRVDTVDVKTDGDGKDDHGEGQIKNKSEYIPSPSSLRGSMALQGEKPSYPSIHPSIQQALQPLLPSDLL
ncbi:uncharacterized protein IWZ02DRAFT_88463 [Phyllosticta citriasiana]|uniref:uncharacterized protein n=1 Tax=Phyllosticta citriasiana TaxID=595635 RepID=UPI0030FD4ECD